MTNPIHYVITAILRRWIEGSQCQFDAVRVRDRYTVPQTSWSMKPECFGELCSRGRVGDRPGLQQIKYDSVDAAAAR